ncbi:MAG: hypothetical protein KAT65_19220 [Methanophagales archaeon]|nr:hypothetical protein [Methanophagales archaeon]
MTDMNYRILSIAIAGMMVISVFAGVVCLQDLKMVTIMDHRNWYELK